ncbi:MAG: helix-turn-helix domain-containing protein, partial [Pikeienuella sp.]
TDLPTRFQAKPGRTNLTVLERAERDAIVRTLAVCKGNKTQAAARLGLGRSTLYVRLRYFGIE